MPHRKYTAFQTATEHAETSLKKEVSASATSSATSNISQIEADIEALKVAKSIAKVCAETSASLVNIAQDYIFYVTNLNDSGPGSLRYIIENCVNLCPAVKSSIYFNVSGTIKLNSDLPNLNNPTFIFGQSSPGWKYDGNPTIAIDCNGNRGLRVSPLSLGTGINGIEIKNASNSGIIILSKNCRITDCYIHDNLENGILLGERSSDNLIGEPKCNLITGSKIPSNVISKNGENGIFVNFSQNNRIVNNYIGLNYTGTIAMGNKNNGIQLVNSDHNILGNPDYTNPVTGVENNPTGSKGTVTPVFVVPPFGNTISGNEGNGISIQDCFNTTLYGNFVGVDYIGMRAIPNKSNGCFVTNCNYTRFLGCTITNNPFVYYNIFSGNMRHGLEIIYSNNTYVQGNFLGVGSNNNSLLPNGLDGINVGRMTNNTIVGGVIPLGNVISGNTKNGIHVTDTAQNFETYNTFAGLFAFIDVVTAPNGENGILIDCFSRNITLGSALDSRTNVFSGNNKNGIEILGNVEDVIIEAAIIGLNTSGGVSGTVLTIPNKENGVHLGEKCSNIIIGKKVQSIIFKNVISGNLGCGVLIDGTGSNNIITNSIIGLNIEEQEPKGYRLGNKKDGILLNSNANKVIDIGSQNVIASNSRHGIKIGDGFKDNIITHNYVGINQLGGIYLNKTDPQIVGNSLTNIIAGNIFP